MTATVSLPALFDGTTVRLLGTPPTTSPTRVIVTFPLAPQPTPTAEDMAAFWATFGAWNDEAPSFEALIATNRRSKSDPPAL